MAMVFASGAIAQTNSNGDCSGLAEQQGVPESFFVYIPEVNGCVGAEGLPNPTINIANSVVVDADTGEELGVLKEIADLSEFQTTETYCGAFPLIDGTTAQNYYDGVQGEGVENVASGVANGQEQALLDPNGDGVACTAEDLAFVPGSGMNNGGMADGDTTPPAAEQPTDNGMTNLPDTGGPALLLPVAGLAMLLGLGGLILRRRLS